MEYLIKRTDGEWFELHVENFAATLKPRTFDSQVISGWGDHRIVVAGLEISFSFEDPGVHVVFYGEVAPADAERIVTEICENIVEKTGQKGMVVPL